MENNNKYILISSYKDEVKYYNDVIEGKEHRSPIFTGEGDSGKSTLFKMVQNGDINQKQIDNYFNKIMNNK